MPSSPTVLTVDFMAWQAPQKIEQEAPTPPQKKVVPKAKPKEITKPKKEIVKQPKLSMAEPIETPPKIVEEEPVLEEVMEEVVEEVLPTPVPIFEVSSLPRFVHRQSPQYPPAMKAQSKEGTVLLEALVDATGKVRQINIIESAGALFDQAAMDALMGSTLIPANTNGKPVPVLLRVPIRFRLR